MNELQAWGWEEFFERQVKHFRGFDVARVCSEHKRYYKVWSIYGELTSKVIGKLLYDAVDRCDLPAVGDWVVIKARPREASATIHAVLKRRSSFLRFKDGELQVVGANIDTVFLVFSLNVEPDLRKVERYIAAAYQSGVKPVVVLSKADLSETPEEIKSKVLSVSTAPVHVVSVFKESGVDELKRYFCEGKTIALLGPSGVGKSTLINYFLGEKRLAVAAATADGQGKHTTTSKQLLLLPSGGLIIDTPGMRDLQLCDLQAGLDIAFQDIQTLAQSCRFADCNHEAEPDCAVKNAVSEGQLSLERLLNYKKLLQEVAEKRLSHKSLRSKKYLSSKSLPDLNELC
ncbi:MAG: ribosome small subunit-dependent GTPase A [Acidobacteriota bacterium]|nr:ribosome small subunit-dependent GTPase A [Blastocatellia bacterium]MDW8412290.1 ribosome small subunit-dependent GTPase A [Acidobacteriota bacterium]